MLDLSDSLGLLLLLLFFFVSIAILINLFNLRSIFIFIFCFLFLFISCFFIFFVSIFFILGFIILVFLIILVIFAGCNLFIFFLFTEQLNREANELTVLLNELFKFFLFQKLQLIFFQFKNDLGSSLEIISSISCYFEGSSSI